MNSKGLKTLLLSLFVPVILFAQAKNNDPVVLSIDKYNITKSEFLRVYNKNNQGAKTDAKALKEYMDLFVNYKLKVIEAEHLGYDTASSFTSEYKSYRDQLAKPYLSDAATEEVLLKEAYQRMLEEVNARHFFVKVGLYASAADTLAAYNKVMEAVNLLKSGTPWDTVALKYSDDRNVRKNGGNLGFFTAFKMIYPIEEAAFRLKPNEISKPIRSAIGYHVVQVLEKRPSRGEMKVAHIMAAFPEDSSPSSVDSVRNVIDVLYKKLLAGENFEELAKNYSDDKRSGKKGGELNWFGAGDMIPEFENAAFAITKDGDFSQPIRTTFGYHIIKRIAMRPISPFDSIKNSIRQRIQRDERAKMGQTALIEKVKKEVAFKDAPEKLKTLLPLLDSSIFTGKWDVTKAVSLNKEILFTLNKKAYTVKDFAEYLAENNHFKKAIDYDALLRSTYKDYVNAKIIDFENANLEEKYPEFKFLIQEYHDGILLFNLMETKIWSQAAKDSVGLDKFYAEHKDTYKWGERVESLIVTSKDEKLLKAAYAFGTDFANNKITAEQIWKKICPDTTQACLNCQVIMFEKGDNSILDSLGWEAGVTPIVNKEGKFGFFVKKSIVPARPKTYEEAKGTCIADYQEYLEKKYLEEMRKKYKVVVYNDVLESIK